VLLGSVVVGVVVVERDGGLPTRDRSGLLLGRRRGREVVVDVLGGRGLLVLVVFLLLRGWWRRVHSSTHGNSSDGCDG